MNIVIIGGTGFVGAPLTYFLLESGHHITVIGRSAQCRLTAHDNLHYISADTTLTGEWQSHIGKADAYINLAGRSVFNLWTEKYKKQIYDSRILTTKNLVASINTPDAVLLNASAAGYYGDGGENEKQETAAAGNDFLAKVCTDWEHEALQAVKKGTRVVTMRFGVILGRNGGAVQSMKLPFKLGLGGPIGSGKQWFPWIHLEDLINAIVFLLYGDTMHGAFNLTAPEAVRQKDFARQLGKALHRPACIPTPAFIMKTVLGEFGRSLLQGQKIAPKALQENGYIFAYPELAPALAELMRNTE